MFLDYLKLLFQIFVACCKAVLRKFWPPSLKTVHGEIALITGGGHGMGQLFALKLASLGARIVIVDINESGNEKTASLLKESGYGVNSYTCDVSKRDEIKKLANSVRSEVGEVSILINNAGVVFPGDVLSASEKGIQTTFDVNVICHFWLLQEFLPDMKLKNHGHIVAMSSLAGKVAFPLASTYSATKHAIIGYMEALRRELRWEGKTGVKTTCVCPYYVNTGFVKGPVTEHLPLLEPDTVVDKIIKAMLIDQPMVDIPDMPLASLIWSIIPDTVRELILDFQRPPLTLEEMTRMN